MRRQEHGSMAGKRDNVKRSGGVCRLAFSREHGEHGEEAPAPPQNNSLTYLQGWV